MADLASLLRVSAGSVLIRTPYLFSDVGASGIYLSDEALQTLRGVMARVLPRQQPSLPGGLISQGNGSSANSKAFNLTPPPLQKKTKQTKKPTLKCILGKG